jgi:hypothetical protein
VRTQKYLTVLFEGHADAADKADDGIPTDSARQNGLEGGNRNLEEISGFVRDSDPLPVGPIFQRQAVAGTQDNAWDLRRIAVDAVGTGTSHQSFQILMLYRPD